MLLKKFIFNRAIDEKEKCDVSEFKDGDEYGKTKEMMGINSILSGSSQSNNFDDDDLENIWNDKPNENKEIINQEPLQKEEKFHYYTIVACVYMTRYLIAGDSDGLSDPYCVISINGETRELQ